MSINDLTGKIKSFSADIKDKVYSKEIGLKIGADLFIVFIIVLVGMASFGLGKLSAIEKKKTPIAVYKVEEALLANALKETVTEGGEGGASADSRAAQIAPTPTNPSNGLVLASKSGTKYYYPWCSGVDRIKEENKIWFSTMEEAKARGLAPAVGCTGLK
ncbi:MAG: hypothetical protein WC631_00525 [Candidatus Paceibacterota bacterium]|jgi:hypothetical protein